MGSIKAKLLSVVLGGLFTIVVAGSLAVYNFHLLILDFDSVIKQQLDARNHTNKVLSEFKTQVQEWKNVLIRGHDVTQYDKYLQRFIKNEQSIQQQIDDLIARPYLSASSLELLNEFKLEHVKLGGLYRQGLKEFELAQFNTQAGDRAVKGIDRASATLLNTLSEQIALQADERVLHIEANSQQLVYYTVIAVLILLLVTTSVVIFYIQRFITSPVKEASLVAKEIAHGNLHNQITVKSNDEIGSLLGALDSMQTNIRDIQSDLTVQMEQQKQKAIEAGRIKQALDNVSANVMVTDSTYTVIYANQSMTTAFDEMRTELAELLGQLNSQQLLGMSLASIFADQPQQSQLLSAAERPIEVEVTIANRIFNLVANPVQDDDNSIIGVVWEWDDLTEQREAELQVSTIIHAAKNGQLSKRLDASRLDGFMVVLAQGINEMLDAIVAPIQLTASYIDQIAQGEIPKDISTDYQGDFNQIRNSFLTCTEAIGLLISDTNMLVDATSKGLLKQRAQAELHKGDYKTIIAGFNQTLDAIVKPIETTSHYLNLIAQGHIPSQISDDYQGDFIQVKDSLTECARAINALISDTQYLADSAIKGQLNERVDSAKHQGDFASIVQGINHTLDAIVQPINLTANYLNEISQGIIPEHINEDFEGEFAQVRASLVRCTSAVQQLLSDSSLLADAAAAGDLAVRADHQQHLGEFANIITGFNATLDAITQPLNECQQVIGALAQGNLTMRVDGVYHGQFKELQESVNSSVTNLAALVGQIDQTAVKITSSSTQIYQGVTELSHRTESQASSIEQTTASVSELTATVNLNASNAENASQLAMQANTQTQHGEDLLNKTVSAMQAISNSSDEIAKIIQVINEIAFQTNLLALNAAVEAARAGDKGRGFAVVAGEVRQLAQRSAEASKNIGQLINDSVARVKHGMELVDDSGVTLKGILGAVQELSGLMNNIASASKEQSTGISQINVAIKQIEKMTYQNNELVENAGSSSSELEQQALQMKTLMGQFVVA